MDYAVFRAPDQEMIVFIHGIGASSWMWWQSVDFFKEDYQVCLLDLPGHGKNAKIPWTDLADVSNRIVEAVIGDQKNSPSRSLFRRACRFRDRKTLP